MFCKREGARPTEVPPMNSTPIAVVKLKNHINFFCLIKEFENLKEIQVSVKNNYNFIFKFTNI